MKKFAGGLLVAALAPLVLAACGAGDNGSGGTQRVFMLLPNSTTTRFTERDAPLFQEALKKYAPEAEVTLLNAEGDANKQQDQMNDAITQGADVVVLISADSNLAAGELATASQAKVPVVLYDHDAIGGEAAAQVVFDSLQVGEEQGKKAVELINAMPGQGIPIARLKGNPGEYGTTQYTKGQDEFLQPLIDSGKINVVCDKNIQNWDPTLAQSFAEDCLTKENNNVKLFVTMNDGLSGGVIAALTAQHLDGQIPVTGGQDANLDAVQYVAQGKLVNTVFKDLAAEADAAAKVTASVLKGDGVPEDMVNGEIDNKFMKVPAVFLPVQNVTAKNLDVLIQTKTWTWDDICQGATAQTEV